MVKHDIRLENEPNDNTVQRDSCVAEGHHDVRLEKEPNNHTVQGES
jgi:Zn ribbon nucleic-acid-binding protein